MRTPAVTRSTAPGADLLPPGDFVRLGGLEITTSAIVDGVLAGRHRSRRRGAGLEFSDTRPWQPGDDLRHIDWRLAARTGRVEVRRHEVETGLRAMLVLDASASMAWSGDPATRPTKLVYAAREAAALALLLIRQRDAAGLLVFDQGVRTVLPPRSRLPHWEAIAAVLGRIEPGVRTDPVAALEAVVRQVRRPGMVVVLSDLLVDGDVTLRALRYLRHRGHDVLVLHLLDPAERSLQGAQEVRLADPESGVAVTLRPDDWTVAYDRAVRVALARWRDGCRRHGIRYALLPTDRPFVEALRRALGPAAPA